MIPATRALNAGTIASWSAPAAVAGKACVNAVDYMGLTAGLVLEQRHFWGRFGKPDQKEGMQAFIDKRPPVFVDK